MQTVMIIPASITSHFLADMKVSDSESIGHSVELCVQSLTVKGKSSLAQTWRTRLKRDYLTQHLSSRMCILSPGSNTLHLWLTELCRLDSPASHFPALGKEKEQKTSDGYSMSAVTGSRSSSQDLLLQKTSKDCCQQKCQMELWSSGTSSRDWKPLVTRWREEYSARKNAALLTAGSVSSSSLNYPTPDCCPDAPNKNSNKKNGPKSLTEAANWQTATVSTGAHRQKNGTMTDKLDRQVKNWPTPCANKITESGALVNRNGTPWDGVQKPHSATTGKQVQTALTDAVKNFPTTAARDWKGCGNAVDRKDGKYRLDTLEAVVKFGQHAPGNHSTNGNRQESWATPSTMDMLPPKTGEALARNKKKGGCKNLREDVNKPPTTGKLNPRWVETLMNLPIGWCMPSCTSPVTIELMNLDCLAMGSVSRQSQERGKFCIED